MKKGRYQYEIDQEHICEFCGCGFFFKHELEQHERKHELDSFMPTDDMPDIIETEGYNAARQIYLEGKV